MISSENYKWVIVSATFVFQMFGAGITLYSFSVIAAYFADALQLSRTTIMMAMALQCLVAAGISPVIGRALDRYPAKIFFAIGTIALSGGLGLLSVASTLSQYLIAYAVFMAVAMIIMGPIACGAIIARWFNDKPGLALGVSSAGASVGGLTFPFSISLLATSIGWVPALQLLAAIALLVLMPAVFLIQEAPTLADKNEDAEAPEDHRTLSNAELFRNRAFWMLTISIGVLFSVYAALLSNLALIAQDVGLDSRTAAGLVSLVAIFGLIGKIVFGLLIDKLDSVVGLIVAALFMAAGVALLLQDGSTTAIAAAVLVGLSNGGMFPLWNAALVKSFGAQQVGGVMGLMVPILLPFILITVPVSGFIYDQTGGYEMALLVFEALLGLMVISILVLRDKRPMSTASQSPSGNIGAVTGEIV